MNRRTLIRLLPFSSVLVGGMLAAKLWPEQGSAAGADRPRAGRTVIPNVPLWTHAGQRVHFYDDLVKGRVVLINFMFATCQGSGPRTMANLARVQALLGEQMGRTVFFNSVTLDPQGDTPEILARYAAGVGAKPGWNFLTGRLNDITLLRRTLGIYDPDPAVDADRTQHTGLAVYGNDPCDTWCAIHGLLSPRRIATAVLRMLNPAVGAAPVAAAPPPAIAAI